MSTEQTPTETMPVRGAKGHFAKGNKLAKGNSKNRLASRWRNVVLDTFSVDDLTAIVAEIRRQALSGNTQAAIAVLRYVASDAMPKTTKANRKGGTKT